ncbi:MAG: PLP-dependent aminotransferase family protein [Planctomycetes bacterium]|nr:PLP-dependent aminotransferase family protein [Planctomycetota bacterium]
MDLLLDRTSSTPLRQQIVAAIRARIESGEWSPGTRLLSSRDLADRLGVNRTTVVQSYDELTASGLLESGVGRGTFVRASGERRDERDRPTASGERPIATAPPRFPSASGPLAWADRLARGRPLPRLPAADDATPRVALARAVGHPTLYPVERIKTALDRVFAARGRELLAYPSPAGYAPLREELARRLARQGVDVARNELVIVNGSQQGLDLIARLLLSEGGTVLTAQPSFSGALDLFRWHRAQLQGVPAGPAGFDLAALDRTLAATQPRFAYVIPDRANPTGLSLPAGAREALLERLQAARVPVVEDDWLAELRRDDEPPPLKARDRDDQVLYLGTFSKVLAPGLRLGWLLVPKPLFEPLLALKKISDLATNFPAQAVLHELLQSGFIDSHARDLRVQFERRRDAVDAAIDRHFPAAVRPLRPHSGMVCWIELPAGSDVARLVEEARREGIDIAPGAPFDAIGRAPPAFRLSYSAASEAELEPAIARLGALLHRQLLGGSHAAPPLV